jgi:hypothetical protein
MKKLLIAVSLTLFVALSVSSEQSKPIDSRCQRFLPLTAESEKQGVPWSGFFALDTETGQLCRTADWQLEENWKGLPTCSSLSRLK